MLKRYFVAIALLAVVGLSLLPDASQAQQVRWGVGVGGGGVGVRVGNTPYYSNPYGYGNYGYGNYGYGNYRPSNLGYGSYGLGYPSYYSPSTAYYYPNPGYSYNPGYTYNYSNPSYGYSYGNPSSGSMYSYQPGYNSPGTTSYQSFYPPSELSNNAARLTVIVPSQDAEVWFDGHATQQRGYERSFATPPLTAGKSYSYQIRTRWLENGQTRDETRTVNVTPGQPAVVDFKRPSEGGK